MFTPELQQALQNILMQRKQTSGVNLDTRLPEMPKLAPPPEPGPEPTGSIFQTAQSLSNLMGYSPDTTFGYQAPKKEVGENGQQQMGNLSQMKPMDFIKYLAGV